MGLLKTVFASSHGDNPPPLFFWYSKVTSASDNRLIFKIDFFILAFGCLTYFTKWLDQANLSNAYVSGLEEDLKMYGPQYNLAVTCFQVGTILGGIPSNLLLTQVRPRYLLPRCELLWAVLTVATYKVTSYNEVFGEGSSFVGIQYILGSWCKRTAIFSCAAYVGAMVCGYLQSAILAGLGGTNGIPAWRWVFMIEGCMTIVIAMYGFIFFRDTPESTTMFYLSGYDKTRAIERLIEDGR